MAIAYAIDLGGTSVKLGLVDDQSGLVSTSRLPTDRNLSAPDAMALAARRLKLMAIEKRVEPEAVGICCAGLVDAEAGVVHTASNLPTFIDASLRDLVEKQLGVPGALENDANAAAFGEFCQLRRQEPDLRSAVMLVLGTGVGGGVVLHGDVWRGSEGLAGEIGHCIVHPGGRECLCGQRGCLEMYASASAIAGEANRRMPTSNGESWDCEHVFARAAAGNQTAEQIIDEAAQTVALTALNLSRILNLQAVILGGGVSEAGEPFRQRIVDWLERENWSIKPVTLQIRLAQHGNAAGLLGAAALALQARDAQASITCG